MTPERSWASSSFAEWRKEMIIILWDKFFFFILLKHHRLLYFQIINDLTFSFVLLKHKELTFFPTSTILDFLKTTLDFLKKSFMFGTRKYSPVSSMLKISFGLYSSHKLAKFSFNLFTLSASCEKCKVVSLKTFNYPFKALSSLFPRPLAKQSYLSSSRGSLIGTSVEDMTINLSHIINMLFFPFPILHSFLLHSDGLLFSRFHKNLAQVFFHA